MSRITPFLALCAILPSFSLPASAQVVTDHLIGKYATTKEYCADPATQDFEIRRGVIEGPNLHCILGATRPPGPGGTEAYESRCRQGAQVRFGTLTFDLSAKEDHIRISLPEKQDWITLYPCK
jgi:hypothetical protein